jgi:regulator of replication initiation timing
MLEDFDPNAIEDEGLRQVVLHLMNMVETLSAKVAHLTEENQRLRDENNPLKGEQGKPRILPNKGREDLSSEKERWQSKQRNVRSKQGKIPIDREVVVKMDQELLPADAQFKGYEEVVVQDLDVRTDNVKFYREKYYSPS